MTLAETNSYTKKTSTYHFPRNEIETFDFYYDKHAAIIYGNLLNFYKENELFDTILIAGEGNDRASIQAHRIVLSALSEYFLDTFRDAQTVLNKNVLEFKQISASTLKLIIDFMYTGLIEFAMETIEEIIRAASYFKMKCLVDGCCEFVLKHINYANSLAWYRLAKELNLSKVKEESLECIYNHFEIISTEEELSKLSEYELKDLLFNENPHGDFEEYVFLSLVAWINYDKLNREHLSLQLLSLVRFQYLTPKFIIENRNLVNKTLESQDLFYSWLQWHFSQETQSIDNILMPRQFPDKKLAFFDVSNSNEVVIKIHNPKDNSWSVKHKINFWENKRCFSSIVIDDKLITVGGYFDSYETNTVECLDLHTFKGTNLPQMEKKRVSCQLADLKEYMGVVGGFFKGTFVHSIELYNFSSRHWHEVEPLTTLTDACRITAHNRVLYILDFHSGFLQYYDVSTDTWALVNIEKSLLTRFGFAAVEDVLFVIGGEKEKSLEKSVKCFRLSKDSFCEVAPLPHALSYIKTTVFNNKIVICAKTIDNDDVVGDYDFDKNEWSSLSSLLMDSSIHSSVISSFTAKIN